MRRHEAWLECVTPVDLETVRGCSVFAIRPQAGCRMIGFQVRTCDRELMPNV